MKTTHHFVFIGVAVLFLSSSFVAAAPSGVTHHASGGFQCPQFSQVQACDREKDQEEQKCTFELLDYKLSDGKGKRLFIDTPFLSFCILAFVLAEKVIKHTCALPSKRIQCKEFQGETECMNAQCSWTSIVAQPTKGASKCTCK